MSKKFLIHTYTNWCGEDIDYTAIADDELQLQNIAQDIAYTNFSDFGGRDKILEDEFPEYEDIYDMPDELCDELDNLCDEAYGYTIEEFEGTDEEWGWYEFLGDFSKEEI